MENPFSLEGKKILITGASSGIGRQCAISCSQMGANVVLLGRNEQRLSKTFNLLSKGEHLYYSIDLTEYEKIESVISDAVQKVGKIDGFIHAAGIEKTLPLNMMKLPIYNELFGINVIAGFEIAKCLTKKKYISNEKASFVFIASIMSIVANAGLTGYCASKGALVSGCKSMSIELAKKKIRVNTISPGYIQTEMMEQAEKRMSDEEMKQLRSGFLLGIGNCEDVANACIYFLSDASKWVTGTNFIIDGGYSVR
jgi:NAD(P)-dependent dehydrogenase (short-subunit alcohol dehydrogenase family)